MKKYFTCKDGVCLDDITMLHPNLFLILATVMNYAAKHNLPVTITSMIHDRENIVSKSTTHADGRAVDLSVMGWPKHHLNDLEYLITVRHRDIGAISARDLKPRPIVIHDSGYGRHIHLQVKP